MSSWLIRPLLDKDPDVWIEAYTRDKRKRDILASAIEELLEGRPMLQEIDTNRLPRMRSASQL